LKKNTLRATFTPPAPKVRVLRVKKPKKLGEHPHAEGDGSRRGKGNKEPSKL
jgi:hypothetical protein